ncbi:MAG: NADH:ubiquinone reductase (Na(+)-transporting) subunit A, partial [Ekhidna sp.]|nr:NADH:ubiquinone reductase (Na(+)-transporting) subunit A [Ekhidna sp.]
MSQTIRLKKGFSINLAGKPEKQVLEIKQPETFAVKPSDFLGLSRPKLTVKEGDNVKAGTPLFFERGIEDILFTAPVSGEVIEIKRGEKRKVLEVKILADKEVEFEKFNKYSISDISSIDKEEALLQLKKSGAWTNFIQRPFGIIANPEESPKAIFISGFDTHPLAPDFVHLLQGQDQNFQAGIDILKKFTSGTIHLNIDGNGEIPQVFSQANGVQLNKIYGLHPAGNVGVQIHHLAPISKGDVVWTLNPVGIAQVGKLFLDGVYDTSRLVAVTGSQIKKTGYVKTYAGACLNKLLEANVEGNDNRFISGNVLTGEGVGPEGYLGYYHNQISVIP